MKHPTFNSSLINSAIRKHVAGIKNCNGLIEVNQIGYKYFFYFFTTQIDSFIMTGYWENGNRRSERIYIQGDLKKLTTWYSDGKKDIEQFYKK